MIRRSTVLKPIVAGVFLLLASQEVRAQCVTYSIIVTGEVHSAATKKEVVVRIRANRGKRISEAKATPDDNERFRAEMPFNTFVSVHLFGAHNCSRRPIGVEVVLIGDGVAKQTVKLSLEHDFTWDPKLAEWRINRPLALGEPCLPHPTTPTARGAALKAIETSGVAFALIEGHPG
jgi:hypothetical protein